ncbi:MAG: hypothetical protein AAF721_09725 [Myxococcota bacterium]
MTRGGTARSGLRCIAAALAPVLVSLLGCSAAAPATRRAPAAQLQTAEQVRFWEELSRPDVLAILAAWVTPARGPDSVCPDVRVHGAATLFTGGCRHGRTSVDGEAEVLRSTDGWRARMREYGDARLTTTGSVQWWEGPEARASFALDVHLTLASADPEEPEWLAVRYRGGTDEDGWHGRGRLAAEGHGSVSVDSDRLDLAAKRCGSEPLAGHTRLRAGQTEVDITYDGASDCDVPGTAQWTRDGVDQGELTDIMGVTGCAPKPSGSPGDGAPGGALVLLLFAPRRRRRRQPQPS